MILVIPSHNSSAKRSSNQEEVVLKVWKEGFTINDGELHSIDRPENREFLLSVARGLVIYCLKYLRKTIYCLLSIIFAFIFLVI